MANAPLKPCSKPGCGKLVTAGRCEEHARQVRQQVENRRESSAKRGYGYKWQQAREGFLRQHPLCQCAECREGKRRLRAATVVDHIVPHKGDMKLFWDPSNWQAMAKECHDRKTAREDGRWG